MVNVEIPQIDISSDPINLQSPQNLPNLPNLTNIQNLTKYMQWDIELYYNSNNFKSSKFPFSIKII